MTDDTKHVNLAHARADHQRTVMERIIKDDQCPFCPENLARYHTRPILKESKHWILTENFSPYKGSATHWLLIPKEHCTSPDELSPDAWMNLQIMFAYARAQLTEPGGVLIMRWGDSDYTGASVTHLHAQLVTGAKRAEDREPLTTWIGYQTDTPTEQE
jgi:diadenosine tetraphosphate (Ap4A) HIT family hydrolase